MNWKTRYRKIDSMKKKKGEDGVFHEADVASLRTLKWTEEVEGRQGRRLFLK